MDASECVSKYVVDTGKLYGIIIFIIYVIITAIGAVFGNLLVSIAILRRPGGQYKPRGKITKLPKTRNILILNLSIADILMGIFLTMWLKMEDDVTSMITFSLCFTSSSCHLAIAIDRFYRIFYFPTIIEETTERRILYGVSIALWMIPLTLFTCLLVVDVDAYHLVTYTLSPVVSLLVVGIIAVLYSLIFIKVRKHEKTLMETIGRKKFEKTKLILKAYATLVVADAVCWLPWIVEALRIYVTQYATVAEKDRCLDVTEAYFYTFSLGLLNASANAVIYWRTLPDIKRNVAEIVGKIRECLCCQKKYPVQDQSAPPDNFNISTSRFDSIEGL